MPNLKPEHVEAVKAALTAAGRADLAAKFTFPMENFHPCWPALKVLERRADPQSREAYSYIYWNMLGMD